MFVEINGNLLNTVSFGAGATTFLAIGGWVGSWEVWQQPFELLSTRWRCVSFDHRGAGESPVPLSALDPKGLVDDVFAVMDALAIDRCILAGESLGAVIALEAAVRSPGRFSGLVLVDGAPAVTPLVQPLIDGSKSNYPATVKSFVDACTPEPGVDHLRRWGRDILLRSDGPTAARMFECYLERKEPPPALDRVTLPTLILHGEQDAIVPVGIADYMASAIPKAKLVKLAGVGHVPTVTRPKLVVDAILDWSAQLA